MKRNKLDVRDYQSNKNDKRSTNRNESDKITRQQKIRELDKNGNGCVGVLSREGENIDKLLNRFKKKIKNSELLIRFNHKRFFKKPSFMKKLKEQEAKRLQRQRDKINDDWNKL